MSNNTANCWQKASTIAQYLQVVIVLGSVILIGYQLHQQVKLNRAANTQNLVNLVTPVNLRLTDPQIAELWVKGLDGIDKEADETKRQIEREQFENLVVSHLIFYENVFSQNHDELLDYEIYEGWDKDLQAFIKKHQVAKLWDQHRDLYRKGFRERVDQIIASQKSTP